MTHDSEHRPHEDERLKLLKERREDWLTGSRPMKLEDRFGPGTFGCHEAVHVNSLIVRLIDNELLNHSAVLLDPEWYHLVREAQRMLYEAYRLGGNEHLDK